MSEITSAATMTEDAITLDLDGKLITIPLAGDIDFTHLAKNLTVLIEQKSSVDIAWADAEEPTDKMKVAKEVINKIIASFNEVIEEQFDEEEKSH